MNAWKRMWILVPLLAVGCMSATQYFGTRANRLILTNDAYMRRNAKYYAPHVAQQYTRFLGSMRPHPSLDGIRIQILMKRAESFRAMNREDLAGNDLSEAARIRATSPFFAGAAAVPPGAAAAPLPTPPPVPSPDPGAPPGETVVPVPTPAPSAGPPWARRPGGPAPGAPGFRGLQPEGRPRITLNPAVAVHSLTRGQVRSDSRSHGDFTYDLAGDLGLGRTTGAPRLSLDIQPPRGKANLSLEFWTSAFNGEVEAPAGTAYDGWTAVTGENLRTRLTCSSFGAFLSFAPSARLSGKVDLEIGLKTFYVETRLHGEFSGRQTDALPIPLGVLGVSLKQPAGPRVTLGAKLRAGVLVWSNSAYSVTSTNFEAEGSATILVNDRLDLRLALNFEHVGFKETKSGDRRKVAALGFGGGYAQARFKF